MPKRNLVLTTGEVYHVFNRSVGKTAIFHSKTALNKATKIVNYYRLPQSVKLSRFKTLSVEMKNAYLLSLENKKPLVEIYCYAFMPNHYHFLLKQITEKGISLFISNFQNSFAKIFNLKNDRNGALFQNPFKAKRVETDEQLIHLSRYIHLNPVTSYLIEFNDLLAYPWTSFPNYAGDLTERISIEKELVEKLFPSHDKYREFVGDQVAYQRNLALIKDQIID